MTSVGSSILLGCIATIVSALLAIGVRRAADRLGFSDHPDQNRKLQRRAIPLGGGVAVFGGILAAVAIALLTPHAWQGPLPAGSGNPWWLLAAAFVMLVLGLLDDRLGLRGRDKLMGQIFACSLAIASGLIVQRLDLFGWRVELGLLAAPVTLLGLLLATNAINLLDGMDGMTVFVCLPCCVALALVAALNQQAMDVVLLIAMAGGLLGFLLWNFPPAKMYLGDGGALMLGFLTGALTIRLLAQGESAPSSVVPLALWTLPLMDTGAALLRRKLTGQSIYQTDRAHLHHRMQVNCGSIPKALAWVALSSSCTAAGTVAAVYWQNAWLAVAVSLTVATLMVVTRTFGFVEAKLLAFKMRNALAWWWRLARTKEAGPREGVFRLYGRCAWDSLWEDLKDQSQWLGLHGLRLNLNSPRLDEFYHALWESPAIRSAEQLWFIEIPLIVRGKVVGRLTLSGAVADTPVYDMIEGVAARLEGLLSQVEELVSGAIHVDAGPARPRVVFFNRSYWPDAEATGQLLTELCEDLVALVDVEVVAGQPNKNPSREPFRRVGKQTRNGVEIRRVWHTRLPKEYLFARAVNMLTFLISTTFVAVFQRRPDVAVLETDPPLLCLLGTWLQRVRGAKLIVYLQDIYPDVAIALNKVREGWLTRFLRRRFLNVYRHADRVVVPSNDMRDLLCQSGVSADRIVTVPNWIDTERVYPLKMNNSFRDQHELDGQFVVMYSGNLGLTQRLGDVVLAAERLRDRSDIVILLVGDGVSRDELQQQSQRLSLSNIRFLPHQPKEALAASLSAADLHLIPVDPRVVRYLFPSKLYGALASATPVLAVAPADCELSSTTVAERVGFVVPPAEPAALADAIRWGADNRILLREMGDRGRELAERCFTRRICAGQFATILSELLGRQDIKAAWNAAGTDGGGRGAGVAESTAKIEVTT